MKRQRFIEILKTLLVAGYIEDIDFFAEMFKVSRRTIQNDLKEISRYLKDEYNLQIIKNNQDAYLIDGKHKNIKEFRDSGWESIISDFLDNATRVDRIIKHLLIYGEVISNNKLSNDLYVSKSSISTNMKEVRRYFFINDKNFLLTDKSGTRFTGTEKDLQNILNNYILDKSSKSMNSSLEKMLSKLKYFFGLEVTLNINDILNSFFDKLKDKVNLQNMNFIKSYIIILIGRKLQNHNINSDVSDSENLEGMQTYLFSLELSEKINEILGIDLMEYEVKLINEALIAGGVEPIKNINMFEKKNIRIVENIIKKISNSTGVELTDDIRLKEGLVTHISTLVYRLENDISIKNPLLSMIKKKYLTIYILTWFAMMDLEKEMKVSLSEDEVSFVMIHIQAALERKKKNIKVLYVCPNGYATSNLLASQVKQLLPIEDDEEFYSVEDLRKKSIDKFDFIISTIPLDIHGKKIVTVSPILTQKDIKNILDEYGNWYINKNNINAEKRLNHKLLSKFIIHEDIMVDCSFKTREEAIDFICANLENESFISNEFRDSVYKREAIESTVITSGVAIPHGNPNYVCKSKIKLLVNKNDISWGDSKVRVVIFLAINKSDIDEIKPVLEKIFGMIRDLDSFQNNFFNLSADKIYNKIL